jgi:hypothetical protein
MLSTPGRIYEFTKDLIFPPRELSDMQLQQAAAEDHWRRRSARLAIVDQQIQKQNPPAAEIPARRRWEYLIAMSKEDINEWDWDAQFADLEDTGDRKALYLAIFESVVTKEPRLRRERFHREALERAKKVDKKIPPVEKREFLAKEVAIAAARGHIGDQHYEEVTKGIIPGNLSAESMTSRDKIYKVLVEEHFIPRIEKFKSIIAARDDDSVVEQTRCYVQPKKQLIAKLDRLSQLCKLERKFQEEEKAEWIYEFYMSVKWYTEMERRPGAALEHIYWVQGPECCPKGYKSPDERMWEMRGEIDSETEKKMSELREEFRKSLAKPDATPIKTVDS